MNVDGGMSFLEYMLGPVYHTTDTSEPDDSAWQKSLTDQGIYRPAHFAVISFILCRYGDYCELYGRGPERAEGY